MSVYCRSAALKRVVLTLFFLVRMSRLAALVRGNSAEATIKGFSILRLDSGLVMLLIGMRGSLIGSFSALFSKM
jgi:hypothetical protein